MSYDVAIVRSDIPDDVAFQVACDWPDRGLEYLDRVGAWCSPTYNYSRFLTAFHVNPVDDLHGRNAGVAARLLDKALAEIEHHPIGELERRYFLNGDGKPFEWGSIPEAIRWLRDARDYCAKNPDYRFLGMDGGPDGNSASLGVVRAFSPEQSRLSDWQWRSLLGKTGRLAVTGLEWLTDGKRDPDRLVGEYCDVVQALGVFAIAYGITDEDIRAGMGEGERRYCDGTSGGPMTLGERVAVDRMAQCVFALRDA